MPHVPSCLSLLLALVLAGAAPAPAQTATGPDGPSLTADEPLEIDLKTRSVIARGNARLADEGFELRAETIRYSRETGIGQAEGNVRVYVGGARLVATRVRYFSETGRFEAENVRLGRDPFYLSGPRLSGTREELVLEEGTFFVGEPDPFSPNLAFDAATFFPGEKVVFDDATFRVGPAPFFFAPGFTRPLDAEPTVRLKTDFGFRNNLGAYTRNTVLLPIEPSWRGGVLLDGYTSRGVLIGPAIDYNLQRPFSLGQLRAGYIDDNDAAGRGLDILGQPVEERRFFVRWRHYSEPTERLSLAGTLDWWSDSEVTREFRPDFFDETQQPDTFFEGVYRGENFLLSAFARPQPNDFYAVDQRLPELRFAWLPSPLGPAGLTHQGHASYAHLRDFAPGGPDLESDRFDAYYGWRYAYTPRPWLTLTPVAGGRLTHYADTLAGSPGGSYTRVLGQVGFDARLRAVGRWNYRNETWGIDGLRHLLRPVVQYRYIPEAEDGRGRIPQIDDNVFTTFLEPIDLADRRDIDDLFEENVLRVGIENLFQTRHQSYGSVDLMELNLYQDFRFTTRPGENDYSATHIDWRVNPVHWLDLGLYSRIDPEHLTLRELRTYLRLTDGDRWRLLVATEGLQRQINQFLVEAGYRINPRHEVLGRWRYDARRDELTEHSYGLLRRLGSAWRIGAEIAWQRGSTRESSLQFNVRVDLLAL